MKLNGKLLITIFIQIHQTHLQLKQIPIKIIVIDIVFAIAIK
jgi:hypothetical protein